MTQKKKKNKSKAGRPTVKTPEVIRKIEEAAAFDASVEEMAYYAGIHRDTLYSWLADDEVLSDRITALRTRPILKARQTIINSISDPNHAKWYLEKKKKTEFGNALDITSKGESIVEQSPLQEVLDIVNEELKRRELKEQCKYA